MKRYKTIIIGAGLAGLIAGRNLDDFLILDGKKEIGKPVQCGEGISARALNSEGIGVDGSWVSCRIHKAKRIMPNGKSFGKWHEDPLGYIVDRTAFEKRLAEPISAKIQLNSEVEHLELEDGYWRVFTKNKEVFSSKYIIGADGARSIVRRHVFPENERNMNFYPAIEYLVGTEREVNTSEIEIYFDSQKYVHGYAWIFPKSKQMANIGIGGKKPPPESFKNFLNDFVRNSYGNYELLENRSGLIPVANIGFSLAKNNALLTGDAGGLANPLFKGGLIRAIMSGRIAAECINDERTANYTSKLRPLNILGKDLLRAEEIFNSLDNQTLNELGKVLEDKGTTYLKTLSGVTNLLSEPNLRKNVMGLGFFFRTWWKNRDCLW